MMKILNFNGTKGPQITFALDREFWAFKASFLGFLSLGNRKYVTKPLLADNRLRLIDKYKNLSDSSVLKRFDSFVTNRVNMPDLDVIQTLYNLKSDKYIQNIFHTPGKLNVRGIHCFLSKDKSFYYIGSSLNMKTRYNRDMSNLSHYDTRYYIANPKLYNYLRKYGSDSLDFGCLLIIKNYLVMFSEFNLSPEEISILKYLTQCDLLITEQYFIDIYGLSLNIAPYVGTRESAVLSEKTRKKMSDSRLRLYIAIPKEKWEAIRVKAKQAWVNEPLDSERRKAISTFHGRSVVIED